MNEPNLPMHDGLDRFEQDLKSLTPNHAPKVLPVQAMLSVQGLGASSGLDASSGHDACLVTDERLHRLPMKNRNWLKIASVSWVTGLVAGLMVSAVWTRLMTEENPITEPNLASETRITSEVTNAPPELVLTPSPPSTEPFRVLPTSAFGDAIFSGNNRYFAIESASDDVLQPMMRRNAVTRISNSFPTEQKFARVDSATKQKDGQTDASNSTSKTSPTPNPNSFPKYQGQRQLLKMLMESDDLISI